MAKNFSNFLSLSNHPIYLSIILGLAIFVTTFTPHLLEIKKAKTEQSNHSEKSKSFSISELSVMHVSASVTINFSQDFVFTPQSFSFLSIEKKFPLVKNLSFRLPLLEILFEHFIVTNAP